MTPGISNNSNDLVPKVSKLTDILTYQSNAIVSSSLLKKESGNVTLFAFDKGEGLSEHTASFDAMVCLLEGEAEIKISENSFNLKEGDMIIMPADIPHALKAITQFKMLLIMLKT